MFNLGSRFNPDLTLMTETGQFYDGMKYSVHLEPTWNISPSLDINPTYRIDRVNFAQRGQSFTNHILGIKALLMSSTKTSFSVFVQHNTSAHLWLVNARFRYNPREGNDLYVVYNEGLNTDLHREIPSLPRNDVRTFLLKYTYTFAL